MLPWSIQRGNLPFKKKAKKKKRRERARRKERRKARQGLKEQLSFCGNGKTKLLARADESHC
jgi:hypothetical protein